MSAYYEGDRLRSDLLDGDAYAVAQNIFNSHDKQNSVSSAQLRKFYNDFKSLEQKFINKGSGKDAFLDILPLVKMMKSKAGYARGTKKIPFNFEKWIVENIDSINDFKDFEAFLLHFEAVVGFCYSLGMSNK